ncbi:MAG: Asp-tRNA(Asn)/Glu-tRNA(Gln) amidotransferase GatCAB subunit A [Candidatus Thermofonsia Clade 1 bacterium]|uniref:Asp-tRNA(Asn)/Glu-tRNA(Gln) amidotransferase GatCAB subunit A n=1 Tax=Candidatus Thermofonsia Clade 1 bacterium TaxID=2364210 RepID=A0A2M8PX96_9CHLR|nr:MAG: Asp-tRNA(Asn)/Glu-tRNA(Gln) amidotransferase GatCAB subunit A [Candidatus Thermofonsia Clade 1 bacterium]
MTVTSELTHLSLAEAARAIGKRELSPVALTEAHLRRIEAVNPHLNAFLTVTADYALERARAAEAALHTVGRRSALHGIPFALKDLFETKGIRTTAGAKFWSERLPQQSAYLVELLERLGGVLLGKLNMHEIALGVLSDNPHYGACRNPYNLAYAAGGSSGGSAAAVAAYLCMAALGSDTRGSVRIPAALSGVVGLKPSYGRLSVRGMLPLSYSLDHAGLLARTVEDVALLLAWLAEYDQADPYAVKLPESDFLLDLDRGIQGWYIALADDEYFNDCEPEIYQAVQAAASVFEALGAQVVRLKAEARLNVKETTQLSRTITASEAALIYADRLQREPDAFGADVLARLRSEGTATAVEYAKALRAQVLAAWQMERLFEEYALLITPCTPMSSVPLAEENAKAMARARLSAFTAYFNMAGVPAISVPCGFNRQGLPIGLQLVAPYSAESRLLRAAHAYEQATRWSAKAPPLAV